MSTLYHVMSRGVDKRIIFQDDQDRLRFVHNLWAFNDTNPHRTPLISLNGHSNNIDIASRFSGAEARDLLVELQAFCIMPNHYHLLISPTKENGLSKFLQKINIGYAKYFNIRYGRKGTLFESRFKRIEVSREAHFVHLPYYIHSNPLDLFDSGWRARDIGNPQATLRYLENYRWSSHLDYLGKENFPLVTQREFLTEFFGGPDSYQSAFRQWIESMETVTPDIALEK